MHENMLFGVRWVLLTAAGLTVGLTAGLGVSGPVEALVGMMLVTPMRGVRVQGRAGVLRYTVDVTQCGGRRW